jgi:hypothetical protein
VISYEGMGWRHSGAIAAGVVGVALGGCGASSEFTCQNDAQCMADGPGQCQPDGHCSFPADDCPSGQRYGEHSGSYSGQCVDAGSDDVAGTSGAGSTSPSDASGEATNPVLTTSEPTTADGTTGQPVTATTSSEGSSGEASSSEGTTGEPIDPDLVLWLELERAPDGQVLDSSSFMSHGVCMAPECPEGTLGVLGQGVHLDGIDDAIVVPNGPQLQTLDGLTVAVWIRLDAPPMEHWAVLTKPVGLSIDNSWELYFSSASHLLRFAVTSGGIDYDVELPEPFPVAQWVHVAGSWDANVSTLWVDGEMIGSVDAPAIEFDDQPVLVGADDDHEGALSGHYLGGMDDVRVYRRALTAEEIAALASG